MQWLELVALLALIGIGLRINHNVRRIAHEIHLLRLDEEGEDPDD